MFKTIRNVLLLLAIITFITFLIGLSSDNSKYVQISDINDFQQYLQHSIVQHNKETDILYIGNETIDKTDLDSIFKKIMEDLYLKNSVDSWSYSVNGYKGWLHIEINTVYRTSMEEEESLDKIVNNIMATIIKDNMNDFEKIKAIHDYIILNSEYSLNTTNSAFSPYTLVTEGKGVCSAYALLAYKMLSKCNIEAYIVEGETTQAHAWNLVKLDNKFYHIDTTWDDPIEDRKGLVQYTYFLTSDAYMSKDHKWDTSLYPKATDLSYDWLHSIKEAYTVGKTIHYISDAGQVKQISYTTTPSRDNKLNKTDDIDTQVATNYKYEKPRFTIIGTIREGMFTTIEIFNKIIRK